LAGVGGADLPLEISGIESTAAVGDSPDRRLSIVGSVDLLLADVYRGRQPLCDVLDRSHDVSNFLLERVAVWGWKE
jgi:hypothetical protein